MLVVIAGAGTVGTFLVNKFAGEESKIILIEKNDEKLLAISESHDVLTINGDMLSHYVLRQANVAAADIFIACSHIDSVNILACQLAKRLGAKRCIARVYSEDIFPYEVADLESHLGVDWLVSPSRLAGYKLAFSLFDDSEVVSDNYFASRLDIVKMKVTQTSICLKKKLKSWLPTKYAALKGVYRNRVLLQDIGNYANFLPELGDELLLVGRGNFLPKNITSFIHKNTKAFQQIYIAGTSKSALSALSLIQNKNNIIVIEPNLSVAKEIEEKYEVPVENVDPGIFRKIKELDLNPKGHFICGSDDDAENLTYALNAQDLGFSQITPIVQGGERMRFFERLSFHEIVSPCALAAKEIFRYANQSINKDFPLIKDCSARAIIKEIDEESPELNKSWEEVSKFYPVEVTILGVWKKGKIFLEDDKNFKTIEVGDKLLLASLAGKEEILTKIYE